MHKNKNTIKQTIKSLHITLGGIILCCLLTINLAQGKYVNIESLDIQPVQKTDSKQIRETLKTGQETEKEIRITNFSNETKEVTVYATETTNTNEQSFLTKNINEEMNAVAKWINLPTDKITLQPKESKIIKLNIKIPNNTEKGLHTGAIIIKELNSEKSQISIEKGIRIYIDVEETMLSSVLTKTENALQLWPLILILLVVMSFNILKHYPEPSKNNHKQLKTNSKPFKTKLQKEKISNEYSIQKKIINLIKTTEFQRTFAYIGVATIILSSTFSYIKINPSDLKTQILPSSDCTFEMTIKWKSSQNIHKKESEKWKGKISIPNSKISILEYLDFEHNDQAELNREKNEINYQIETGPNNNGENDNGGNNGENDNDGNNGENDNNNSNGPNSDNNGNDGIKIKITPTQNEIPYIYHTNELNGEIFHFPITDHTSSEGKYPYKTNEITFQAELCDKIIKTKEDKAKKTITIDGETITIEEEQATPFIQSIPQQITNPELENLFINDLPPAPKELKDFIINSNYVQKTSKTTNTQKIETDSILIHALQATPDILEEISTSPDLNFIFIPADPILFPPMEFSFTEDRIIQQPMGTLIFIQNKESSWNTFIGTTDFKLLSGELKIPASALTINPGEPIVLGKYTIDESAEDDEVVDEDMEESEITEDDEVVDEDMEESKIAEDDEVIDEDMEESKIAEDDEVIDEDMEESEIAEDDEIADENKIIDGIMEKDEDIKEDEIVNKEITNNEEFINDISENETTKNIETLNDNPKEDEIKNNKTEENNKDESNTQNQENLLTNNTLISLINQQIKSLLQPQIAFALIPRETAQTQTKIETDFKSETEELQKNNQESEIDELQKDKDLQETDEPEKTDKPKETNQNSKATEPEKDQPSPQAKLEELELSEITIEGITTGKRKTFTDKNDKITLADINPTEGEKTIFILRPTLEIKIPAGMPAGTYQGELTITSL